MMQKEHSKHKNHTIMSKDSLTENNKKTTERPFSSNGATNAFKDKQNVELLKNKENGNQKMFHIIKPPRNQLEKVVVNQRFRNNYRSCFTSGINNLVGDYYIGKSVGQGAYAVVKEGKHKVTGNRVAIKIYEKFRISGRDKRANVENEINILKVLDHPNIPKYIGTIDTSKHLYILMEYCKGISLLTYVKSKYHRQLSESECMTIFKQLVSATAYFHSKGFCHRDIKMDNIIIDKQLNIKLIDFGFATTNKDKLNIFCGTPSYMCPEIVTKTPYFGYSADIWALGILFYSLHAGTYPFKGSNDKELFRKIQKGVYDMPSTFLKSVKTLIKQMLVVVPANRVSCDQLQKDEYFKENYDALSLQYDIKNRCYALYGKEIIDKLVKH